MCNIRNFFGATSIIVFSFFSAAQCATLVYFNKSLDNRTEVPLNESEKLMNCYINKDLLTIFYTFGFTGLANGPSTNSIITTFIDQGDCNVILLDWEKEASDYNVSAILSYPVHGVPNCIKIGNQLGDEIVKLVKLGLDPNLIYLMGLSLGAQLMGYAGRRAKANDAEVSRVIGFDPARELFDPPILPLIPVGKGCAKETFIIHTDPGGCGMNTSTGDVDFWVNYGCYKDGTGHQPGCPSGYELCGNLCSHNRSWMYFLESLEDLMGFKAGKANDYSESVSADGCFDQFKDINYIGPLCDGSNPGNFYLTTNSESPYARGDEGLKPGTCTD